MRRHDPTRRRNNPRYSPFRAVTSPENGSPFMAFSAALTRLRSFAGIERNERSATLLSAKSQFTLQVFEPDKLAAGKIRPAAFDRLDFIALCIIDRQHPAPIGRQIPPQGFANQLGAAAMLLARRVVDFWKHLLRDADGDHFAAHAEYPFLKTPVEEMRAYATVFKVVE